MKNFLCLVGAVASALAVFAAVAVIVKKVKFKFVISSADAEPCDYDCDNCDEECDAKDAEDGDDEDFFDDVPVEEPEVEVEFTSEEPDEKNSGEKAEETEKTEKTESDEGVDASVKAEVDSELGE